MKKTKIRLRSLVVVLILTSLFSFASCTNAKKEQPSETTGASAQTTELRDPLDILREEDFNNEDFVIFTRDDSSESWKCTDMVFNAEGTISDSINSAVFTRNERIQNRFNVHLVQSKCALAEMIPTLEKSNAGGGYYSAVCLPLQRCAEAAQLGYLSDLSSLSSIDLDQSWWDEKGNAETSINHQNFFAMGDVNIGDDNATWCVLVNKDLLATQLGINPYDLVYNNQWTFDDMFSLAKLYTRFADDSTPTVSDTWGVLGQQECMVAFLGASGVHLVTKDADDALQSNFTGIGVSDTVDAIANYMYKSDCFASANDKKLWNGKNSQYAGIKEMFTTGKGLFYVTTANSIMDATVRSMVQSFGLLPLPKYSSVQKDYFSPMQGNNGTAVAIPQALPAVTSAENSALILEAMAVTSTDTLKKTYYETLMKRRYVPDPDSAPMLDLIFNNKMIDIAMVYNWYGDGGNEYSGVRWKVQYVAGVGAYTTMIESEKETFENAMRKTSELFASLKTRS